MRVKSKAITWALVLASISLSIGARPASALESRYPSSTGLQMPASASGKLLEPLLNPEGRCASDVPSDLVTYEDTQVSPENFPGFLDVGTHDVYCLAIAYLVSIQAIAGYPDNTFKPHNVVTRGQFSKMTVKTFGYAIISPTTATYVDVPVGSTFFDFVETATAQVPPLITGYYGAQGFWNPCIPPNGGYEQPGQRYFRPCLNIIRGQVSKILATAAGFTNDVTNRFTFSDIYPDYVYREYIERLAVNIALDEIPFDTPSRPTCATTNRPCFYPGWNVLRNDAAQLLFLTLVYSQPNQKGRAFPRRYLEVDGHGEYDGIQGFVSTPSINPPGSGFVAGPLAVADGANVHFIEFGPDRRCTYSIGIADDAPTVCLNAPYASSGTARPWTCIPPTCRDEAQIVRDFNPASGVSIEYRSYAVPEYNEWWAEYYNPVSQDVEADYHRYRDGYNHFAHGEWCC